MLEEETIKSKDLLTLWEFEGVLKYSPFFYGWYTNKDSNSNYRLPLAYFVTNLVVYTYSFVAILRKYRLDLFLLQHSFFHESCESFFKIFRCKVNEKLISEGQSIQDFFTEDVLRAYCKRNYIL